MKNFFSSLFKRSVIILLIFGILLCVATFGNTIISFKEAHSFDDLLEDGIEAGDRIEGEILYSFGTFAVEDTVTTNKNGSSYTTPETSRFYVIPGYDEFTYYGLEVGKSFYTDLDNNTNETWDYLDGGDFPSTTPMYEGKATKMSDDLVKYFKDWLLDCNYTESEIDSMGEFIVIEPVNFLVCRIMTLVGIVLIAIAILIIILSMKKLKKQESNMTNGAANYNYPQNGYDANAYNQSQNGYDMNAYNQPQNGYDANAYNQSQNGYDMNAYNQPQNNAYDTNYYGSLTDDGNLYSVELRQAGPNLVSVIKVIRDVTGMGLKEAKDIVDNAPGVVKSNISKYEAESIKTQLEAEGAQATII